MKLNSAPGACSLAVQIAMRGVGFLTGLSERARVRQALRAEGLVP